MRVLGICDTFYKNNVLVELSYVVLGLPWTSFANIIVSDLGNNRDLIKQPPAKWRAAADLQPPTSTHEDNNALMRPAIL